MIFGCVSNWTNGAVHFLCFGWLDGHLGSFSSHIYYIFYRQQTGTFKKLKCFNHRLTWSSSMISGYVSNWTRDAVHFHCFGWLDGWPQFVTMASTSVSLLHLMIPSTYCQRRKFLLCVTWQDNETSTKTQVSVLHRQIQMVLEWILSGANLLPPLAKSEGRLLRPYCCLIQFSW